MIFRCQVAADVPDEYRQMLINSLPSNYLSSIQ